MVNCNTCNTSILDMTECPKDCTGVHFCDECAPTLGSMAESLGLKMVD